MRVNLHHLAEPHRAETCLTSLRVASKRRYEQKRSDEGDGDGGDKAERVWTGRCTRRCTLARSRKKPTELARNRLLSFAHGDDFCAVTLSTTYRRKRCAEIRAIIPKQSKKSIYPRRNRVIPGMRPPIGYGLSIDVISRERKNARPRDGEPPGASLFLLFFLSFLSFSLFFFFFYRALSICLEGTSL